jgi:hypothetical protein
VSWQQWLSEFPVTSCLELIAVLQEHCSEYIHGQLKNNLHTLSKECLDQLVTYALSARVNSLEVADLERMLAGNRILATPFPKQVHGRITKSVGIEKIELHLKLQKKFPKPDIKCIKKCRHPAFIRSMESVDQQASGTDSQVTGLQNTMAEPFSLHF